MDEREVVLLELGIPACLVTVKVLRSSEEGEVLVVSLDFKGSQVPKKVLAPFAQSFDNG